QVPAGTFYNCVKLVQIIVDSEGDTVQNQEVYLAKGVGEVLKLGWSEWVGETAFRLIDYSIQSIQVEPVNPPQAGQSLNLTIVSASQNFEPTIKRLYYRSTGESSWQYLNITAPGVNFDVTVPQNIITLRGVEYYVYMSDGQQEITYPPIDPQLKPAAIQVAVSNYTPSLDLQGMTYQMISVPLELTNPQIQNVLGDDYGEYDPEQWRLFRWEDGDYVEYPDITASFTPGAAFWLVTRDSESFDVDNGISTDSSQPFSYTLQPGWNQVANPFAFPVLSDTVEVPENALDSPVYFDGADYQYDVPTIEPWQGYFVYNRTSSPVTILVPPIASQGGIRKLSKRLAINSDTEYMLQLSAAMQNTKLMDTQNYLGLREKASDFRDDLDLAEAPPIGEYIQLSIIENEERFAANFKPVLSPGNQWDVELKVAPLIEMPIHISLLETGNLPEGQQLFILDKDYDCAIPIAEQNFSVKISRGMPVRHFKILVGTKEYAEQNSQGISLLPLNYELGQNFPNPFNPETTIPYQLGKRSEVTLEIYNIISQRIRTLVHGVQSTGQYAVTWDGTDDAGKSVVTGIYICQFQADEFAATQKLILVR
ncbi:T9SS type A sorting domain-containing protein, partial [candidate division KSB1 bacterium]|nr:T9SS type A sorting domain-containing protein [candidate division KSB1 bacterium]